MKVLRKTTSIWMDSFINSVWNKKIFFIIIPLLIFTTACQSVSKEVDMKKKLKIDFQEGDLNSLHPHDLMIYLRGISIGKTLYEGLTRVDENAKVQLAGAKEFNMSPNGLIYTFKLRKNHFSDGTAVKASHYVNAFKEALSPVSFCPRPDLLYMIKNAALVKKNLAPIDDLGIEAVDDETLIIELDRPSPHFLELLAQPISAPLKDPQNRDIQVFNGPFKVKKWDKNASLVLEPNPHFWNKDQVKLDEIDVFMVQDPETAFALYENKELDWIGVPLCPLSIEQIDFLKEKNHLQSKSIDRAFWVFLNTQHQTLSSSQIRKALSLAIDRNAITHNVFLGNSPLEKPLPHSLLPVDSLEHLKEDLIEARRLFNEGLKEIGLTRESFPPLVITYSQQANRKQLAEYLQNAWSQALEIEVKLEPQEWNVLRSNLGSGQFEISGAFEASFYHDPLELMERMVTLNSSNFPQWTFPLYQQKISSASKEINPEQRLHYLAEAENILMQEMPFIPISSDTFLFAHDPKLKGYSFDSVGAIDFSYSSL